MSINNIDPSLALGFYCRDEADYADFTTRVSNLQTECTHCPFSIAETRPDYDLDNMDMASDGNDASIGCESSDNDEDYVLI